MRIGVVGCGAIGSVIMNAISRGELKAELVGLMDIYPEKCEGLLRDFVAKNEVLVCRDLEEFLKARPQLVVEAASQQAVRDYVPKILNEGIDVVLLSVGALLDEGLYNEVVEAAKRGNAKVYIPTGAIAGIDAIKALKPLGIKRVVLRSYKNVKAFDREVLRRLGFSEVKETTKIFEGEGTVAVKLFPANVNVVATLALASGKIPWVEIYADPKYDKNVHEIEVEGEVSRICVRVENVPHPDNPRTSYLAPLSVVRLIKQLTEGSGLVIGT
ncbi:MAG: aspartate dehydrogenase [Thaumarchaeota archaeon]|nr:aspartate dehydrogenase [Candidatus Terraquivivens yellowstonensis]